MPDITALVRLGHMSEPLDFLGIPPSKLSSSHMLNPIFGTVVTYGTEPFSP